MLHHLYYFLRCSSHFKNICEYTSYNSKIKYQLNHVQQEWSDSSNSDFTSWTQNCSIINNSSHCSIYSKLYKECQESLPNWKSISNFKGIIIFCFKLFYFSIFICKCFNSSNIWYSFFRDLTYLSFNILDSFWKISNFKSKKHCKKYNWNDSC